MNKDVKRKPDLNIDGVKVFWKEMKFWARGYGWNDIRVMETDKGHILQIRFYMLDKTYHKIQHQYNLIIQAEIEKQLLS